MFASTDWSLTKCAKTELDNEVFDLVEEGHGDVIDDERDKGRMIHLTLH